MAKLSLRSIKDCHISFLWLLMVSSACASNPANLGELKQEIISYKTSGAYEKDFAKVAGEAKRYLQTRFNDDGRLAIVLDIDETSLSNWPIITANDFGFIREGSCTLPQGPCGWSAWVEKAQAQALKPTLELYRTAQQHGVAVFFITGRLERYRAATERNLRAVGYDDWEGLILRPDGGRFNSTTEYKSSARRKLIEQGYVVLLNMGDQPSDIDGGYAGRSFLLPNPFYRVP